MAGVLSDYVDSGNVSLTNVSDGEEVFTQLRRVRVFTESDVSKSQLTDDTLEKHFDLRDYRIEGEIWLTNPEIGTWIGYTVQTNNLPPAKSWRVTWKADDGGTNTTTGTFRVSRLSFVSEEEGYSLYDFTLESIDGAVAVA